MIRSKNIFTESEDMEHLYTIKNFPSFIGTSSQEHSKDIISDLIFDISKSSGIVQIRKLLPTELVYKKFHSEALGNIWNNHHKSFSKFVMDHDPINVLEIGGSDGFIGHISKKKNKNLNWTVIDLLISEKYSEINYLNGDYSEYLNKFKEINTLVHSHTIEHFYDPKLFLENISDLLETGTKHIFSIPNFDKYLENNYSNILNFEHTFFLNESLMDNLLIEYGFKIIKKQYFEDHSIFYSTEKIDKKVKVNYNNYNINKKNFSNYFRYYEKIISKLNDSLADEKYYLFGAHVFSQFLISMGLNKTNIINILDNSDLKNNKRLYGSNFFIQKPKVIKDLKEPKVIVFAGPYQKEIEDQLKKINSGVKIINEKSIS